MKYLLLLLIVLSYSYLSCAQSKTKILTDSFKFVTPIEVSPKWVGGTNQELIQLMAKKLIYPSEKCITGTTILQFRVDKLGNVIEATIKRSIANEIDDQLLKEIVKHKFIPGKSNNINTDFLLKFPFKIKLE